MTQVWISIDDDAPCHCGDCEWTGPGSDLQMVTDIQERIDPGSTVPAGECPDCGALAYTDASLADEQAQAKRDAASRAMLAALGKAAAGFATIANNAPQDSAIRLVALDNFKGTKAAIAAAKCAGIKDEA